MVKRVHQDPLNRNGPLRACLKIICRFCAENSPWLMIREHSRQQKRKFNHGQNLSRMRLLCLEPNKQSTNSGAMRLSRKKNK